MISLQNALATHVCVHHDAFFTSQATEDQLHDRAMSFAEHGRGSTWTSRVQRRRRREMHCFNFTSIRLDTALPKRNRFRILVM